MPIDWLQPDWPAPGRVRAVATTRRGGVSRGAWTGLNLGDHVGDDIDAVSENRRLLRQALDLPAEPQWLRQVHGTQLRTPEAAADCADACFEDRPGQVCAVLTADCLPLLLCNAAGSRVAAVHAGWRGLLAGVIEQTLDRFDDPPGQLMAWLGPAIGPGAFEVGDEVRDAFVAEDPVSAAAFAAHGDRHWLADLYALARHRLVRRGVLQLSGGDCCTYSEPARFFSYRRDGTTGRMASLIWIQP